MKKYLIIVATALISLTLVSCGGKKGPAKSLEELGYNPNGLPIVKEQVEYKITAPKNALALDYNDMDIFKEMLTDTNVKVNWENLSEETFQTTRNMIVGSKKNRPDAMYHAGFSDRDIIQYSASGTIIPLDKYLDNMPNFKNILEKRPDIKEVITSPDGHIYALPRVEEMGLLQHPNMLFVNKTWINKLSDANLIKDKNNNTIKVEVIGGNLAEDSTNKDIKLNELTIKINNEVVSGFNLDQYEAILTAMKDNASFLTQEADKLIPLTFRYGGWQGNQADLYSAFGIAENIDHLTVVDGKVTFTATDSKFKDATNSTASWITKGLIDKEILSQSDFDLLTKGKGNAQRLGSFYWWEKETVIKPEWQDDYVAVPPLIGHDGKQNVGISNNHEVVKGQFVVFENAENPEVLLTWIDRFYDPIISAQINYGPKGIVFQEELNEDGMLVEKPLPEGVTSDELRLKNAPMGIVYLSHEQWENTIVMEYRARLRLVMLEKYIKPYVYENVTNFPNVTYTLSEINQIQRLKSDIDSYTYQTTTKWLLNGGVSDSEWSSYIAQLNKMKLNELLDIHQAAYNRLNK
ncbi:type 2 periplasmic-binding domain-containing protein [Haploplasma axanthum]|uniref:ABC transporter substrate-binding protein n=1 Tax=Haploplasma axanthum TaxID=29552 RepID=A0A449BFR0_HAPAX|nr:hypothetical protein [Haploplasma axanthum]VEU81289.1 Uncharacterised protein [Haploplasma axanthum]